MLREGYFKVGVYYLGGSRRGFTVVELTIVVLVVAILAAIITVSYRGVVVRADQTSLKSELQDATGLLARYKAKNGIYPDGYGIAGISGSDKSSMEYSSGDDWFCLSVTSNKSAGSFNITESNNISEGLCPFGFQYLSAGQVSMCGVSVAKRGYCWGGNSWGILGINQSPGGSRSSPVPLSSPLDSARLDTVSVTNDSACALSAGDLYCWGNNSNGSVGDGASPGQITVPKLVTTGSGNYTGLASGSSASHMCALVRVGMPSCWGHGSYGKLGDGSDVGRNLPVTVTQGVIPVGETLLKMGVGGYHTCALSDAAQVYCWGYSHTGQLGNGSQAWVANPSPLATLRGSIPSGERVTDIGTGFLSTCALTDAGRIYCWGGNSLGQLGDGTVTTRSTPVRSASTVSEPFVSMSVGGYHVCAITGGGSVYCWGRDIYGQIGRGDTAQYRNTAAPIVKGDLTDSDKPAGLFLGIDNSCVITERRQVYCWGYNGHGQLGDGSSTNRPAPVKVNSP